MATVTVDQPTPDHILQLGLGFWASEILLSAVEMGLFTELAHGPPIWKQCEADWVYIRERHATSWTRF